MMNHQDCLLGDRKLHRGGHHHLLWLLLQQDRNRAAGAHHCAIVKYWIEIFFYVQEKIKDGFMTWENFNEMMLDDKAAYVAIMFKKYDLNDDGKITPEERQEIQERMANENPIHATKMTEFFAFMMANFDTDGDGIITKEEFLTGVRNWMDAKSKKICPH